jgi:hypothetical protein
MDTESADTGVRLNFNFCIQPVLIMAYLKAAVCGETQENTVGQLASIKYSTRGGGGCLTIITSYSNSLASVCNAVGEVVVLLESSFILTCRCAGISSSPFVMSVLQFVVCKKAHTHTHTHTHIQELHK